MFFWKKKELSFEHFLGRLADFARETRPAMVPQLAPARVSKRNKEQVPFRHIP